MQAFAFVLTLNPSRRIYDNAFRTFSTALDADIPVKLFLALVAFPAEFTSSMTRAHAYFDIVKLPALMNLSQGSTDVSIALIDGPVFAGHSELAGANIINAVPACDSAADVSCLHGTFIAGMLCARRDGRVPGICPACTVLSLPIFASTTGISRPASTGVRDLAAAIDQAVSRNVFVINLSVAVASVEAKAEAGLKRALDGARARGCIVVAASGNNADTGGSVLTRHPWVIPVASYRENGLPDPISNLSRSIGRSGLGASGENRLGLGPKPDSFVELSGTSIATAYVAGSAALLKSMFPQASPAEIVLSLRDSAGPRRGVLPPLLNAWAAYQRLASQYARHARRIA